jgi:hypothetical protein
MALALALHPITNLIFGDKHRLDGNLLTVDVNELRRMVLEDNAFDSVEFEIVRPARVAGRVRSSTLSSPGLKHQAEVPIGRAFSVCRTPQASEQRMCFKARPSRCCEKSHRENHAG